ncbi:hypothetical protein, conserved [Eimeria necatrix]|uniref:Transmembrane protein 131-like N-terminal domain-containing protein n=1 Tax=Eimeria necatrix TaxID=51315 RepID=U6MSH0_9EIME|nr:hypothetical protein, conserved [Eimeria necatrix]CDJ65429.1 hypothetical protein, conserved [Eimeria necatrix]
MKAALNHRGDPAALTRLARPESHSSKKGSTQAGKVPARISARAARDSSSVLSGQVPREPWDLELSPPQLVFKEVIPFSRRCAPLLILNKGKRPHPVRVLNKEDGGLCIGTGTELRPDPVLCPLLAPGLSLRVHVEAPPVVGPFSRTSLRVLGAGQQVEVPVEARAPVVRFRCPPQLRFPVCLPGQLQQQLFPVANTSAYAIKAQVSIGRDVSAPLRNLLEQQLVCLSIYPQKLKIEPESVGIFTAELRLDCPAEVTLPLTVVCKKSLKTPVSPRCSLVATTGLADSQPPTRVVQGSRRPPALAGTVQWSGTEPCVEGHLQLHASCVAPRWSFSIDGRELKILDLGALFQGQERCVTLHADNLSALPLAMCFAAPQSTFKFPTEKIKAEPRNNEAFQQKEQGVQGSDGVPSQERLEAQLPKEANSETASPLSYQIVAEQRFVERSTSCSPAEALRRFPDASATPRLRRTVGNSPSSSIYAKSATISCNMAPQQQSSQAGIYTVVKVADRSELAEGSHDGGAIASPRTAGPLSDDSDLSESSRSTECRDTPWAALIETFASPKTEVQSSLEKANVEDLPKPLDDPTAPRGATHRRVGRPRQRQQQQVPNGTKKEPHERPREDTSYPSVQKEDPNPGDAEQFPCLPPKGPQLKRRRWISPPIVSSPRGEPAMAAAIAKEGGHGPVREPLPQANNEQEQPTQGSLSQCSSQMAIQRRYSYEPTTLLQSLVLLDDLLHLYDIEVTPSMLLLPPRSSAAIRLTLRTQPCEIRRGFQHMQNWRNLQVPLAFQLHVMVAVAGQCPTRSGEEELVCTGTPMTATRHLRTTSRCNNSWLSSHLKSTRTAFPGARGAVSEPTSQVNSCMSLPAPKGRPIVARLRPETAGTHLTSDKSCRGGIRGGDQSDSSDPREKSLCVLLYDMLQAFIAEKGEQQSDQRLLSLPHHCPVPVPRTSAKSSCCTTLQDVAVPSTQASPCLPPLDVVRNSAGSKYKQSCCSGSGDSYCVSSEGISLQERQRVTHQFFQGCCVLSLPRLELSPTELHFAGCPVGECQQQALYLYNCSAELSLDFCFDARHPFRCMPSQGKVPPQQQVQVQVIFAPTRMGPVRQKLNVFFCNRSYSRAVWIVGTGLITSRLPLRGSHHWQGNIKAEQRPLSARPESCRKGNGSNTVFALTEMTS